ncbi:MAG: tetratricopeptide repeat protein [Melioribacteraceae bacterium]|jgi:tetratricopeptide (TPR) repeat protein|nr:tetratricopeptide repeat protein [Melioribacteraceae bacterium]RJP57758.1 MAG: tetratricopeptide repeat protein [Ignavibacteriales bacterium]WKZ70551.1 MAG: tetratricopeptide repeat protein [Melioribacteraceae bacterium]
MKRVIVIISLLAMIFGITAFQCASTEITSARLYMQQDNNEKAKEALMREIQANPKSDEGYYLLGYLYGEEGDYAKMTEYFGKSIEISNKFAKEIQDSRNYHWADNFNKGVAFFNRAAQTNNEDSTQMFFDKSIERFENAILVQPDSTDTYKNLTFAYINAGRIDEAVEPLKNLIAKEGSAESYTMLGEIYITQGQNLKSAFQTSGDAADSIKANQKFEEAVSVLEKGHDKYPNNGEILLFLSNAYINANKLDIAMNAFKEGVAQDPNNKYYRYNYGVLLLEANDFDGAEDHFLKAIELDPDYSNAIYNLAATYVKWGTQLRDKAEADGVEDDSFKEKFNLALPHLEKYLELNPDDAQIWELLGRVYANLGMTEKSMEAFDMADKKR